MRAMVSDPDREEAVDGVGVAPARDQQLAAGLLDVVAGREAPAEVDERAADGQEDPLRAWAR